MKRRMFKPFMLALGALSLVVVSCKKDEVKPAEPTPPNESELITTMELHFTDTLSGNTFKVVFDDPDGIDGGNSAVKWDTINLKKKIGYKVDVFLLDKSKATKIDTISNEVFEEANDHLFFYASSPVSLVNVQIKDKDSNGKNLGLKSIWSATDAGSGKVNVKLMHQPGKKDGTSANGDTDIDIDFQVNVK